MFNRRKFVSALVAVGSVGVPSLSFAAQETSRENLVRLCEELGFDIEFDSAWSILEQRHLLWIGVLCSESCSIRAVESFGSVAKSDMVQFVGAMDAEFEEMSGRILGKLTSLFGTSGGRSGKNMLLRYHILTHGF